MKKMHWSGIIATGLISMSAMAGCSGDDAPPVTGNAGTSAGGSGTAGTAGSGTSGSGTAGSGTAGTAGSGTSGSGTGGSGAVGVQLQTPDYYTQLTGADATAGAAAPGPYSASTCNGCHGMNGEGDQLGPEIRYTPTDYLTWVVRNGRKDPKGDPTIMPALPVAALSDADLASIGTWLNSFPKPMTGQGLYKAMCGNCHGPMTPTGGSAPINIQGIAKAELTKYVRMGNGTDPANRKEYMPKYDTTLLTDAELESIATYIGAK